MIEQVPPRDLPAWLADARTEGEAPPLLLDCREPAEWRVATVQPDGAELVQMLLAQHMHSKLTVNNYFGVLQGVLNHVGIGILPDYLISDFPDMVRVLPEVQSGEVPVFLAFPEELRTSRRVTAFRDFVLEEIQSIRRNQVEDEPLPQSA